MIASVATAISVGRRLGVAALVLWCVAAAAAWGLTPEEILVVANSRRPAGVEVAKQYCAKRHVPARQLVSLPMPTSDTVSRRAYNDEIAGPLRQFLNNHPDLNPRIRCLLTVYGVPLVVGPHIPTREEKAIAAKLSARLEAQRPALVKQVTMVVRLARGAGIPVPSALTTLKDAPLTLDRLLSEVVPLNTVLAAVGKKVQPLRPTQPRVKWYAEARERLLGRGAAAKGEEARALREYATAAIGSKARDKLYAAREKAEGLVGVCAQMAFDIGRLEGRDSTASVDSELSLLYWGHYDLYRWQPNLLNPMYRSMLKPPYPPRTLMVSRLDGPSAAVAGALVDRALEGESRGLLGTFYIDASATKRAQGGTYELYDKSLGALAGDVREHTSMKVVLDTRRALFAPGACPHAALYCGWYSPRKYIDSFKWEPGAVGYHITSFGAQGLHNPHARNWCVRMLEKGVAATLGPVSEPYLRAFPPPQAFFELLLSGRVPLVECYYRTKPFNSWRMVLIGDPLYNPFRHHPVLLRPGAGTKPTPKDRAKAKHAGGPR